MSPDGIVLAAIAVLIIIVTFVTSSRGRRSNPKDEQREQMWAAAVADEDSQMGRILVSAARRLSDIPAVGMAAYARDGRTSEQYSELAVKLRAAGVFGSSVEVYLAVQFAGILAAIITVLVTLALGASGLAMFAGLLIAGVLAWWPWDRVKRAASKKSIAVSQNLPDFAEMLVMPLSAGKTVLQSMSFVAEQLDGPVSDEARNVVNLINAGTSDEIAAFENAAQRLGTPSARILFATLLQGYREGVAITPLLADQARALRLEEYQRRRAENKKLPTKLVIIFGIHLLPLLLAVILIPIVLSFGQV